MIAQAEALDVYGSTSSVKLAAREKQPVKAATLSHLVEARSSRTNFGTAEELSEILHGIGSREYPNALFKHATFYKNSRGIYDQVF